MRMRDPVLKMMLGILFLAGVATAGTMVVGRTTYEGVLEGYEDGRFVFRTTEGKVIRQTRAAVSRLVPGQDCRVSYERLGKKRGTARLVKYEKMRFVVEKDGKEETLFGAAVKRLIVTPSAPAGGGAGGGPGGQAVVSPVDISGIEGNPDKSPQQVAALSRYKTVRAKYEQFLAESTRLVAEMDGATGRKRDKLLEQLRFRKIEQRPLVDEVRRATDALYKAFPEK